MGRYVYLWLHWEPLPQLTDRDTGDWDDGKHHEFGGRRREVLPDNKEVRLISTPVIDCARLSPPELGALTHCGVDSEWVGGGIAPMQTRLRNTTEASIGGTAMAVVQLDTEDHQPENGFVSSDTASQELLTRIDGSVLPFLGGFGKYQKQLIVLTWIPALFIGFSQYSSNFILAQPNTTCVQPLANLTDHTASRPLLSGDPRNISARPAYIYDNGSDGTHSDNASMPCKCSEWTFELHAGLAQNVVTKVSGVDVLSIICTCYACVIP